MKKDTLRKTLPLPLIGLVLILLSLGIVVLIPYPSPAILLVIRVLLGLGSALVFTSVPGTLHINLNNGIIAGGAFAIFVIVFFTTPADFTGNLLYAAVLV